MAIREGQIVGEYNRRETPEGLRNRGNEKGSKKNLMPPWSKDNPPKNPGRKKMSIEAKELRKKLTPEAYEKKILFILSKNIGELQAFLQDKTKCALDHWIARITLIGIKKGDPRQLEYFLIRLIGRVEANVTIQGHINHKSLQAYIEDRGEVIKIEPRDNG